MNTFRAKEIADRGQVWYARLRPQIEPLHNGKAMALDVDSGDYEVDTDEDAACDRLEARRPHGTFYLLRVGYPASLFVKAFALAI